VLTPSGRAAAALGLAMAPKPEPLSSSGGPR
jgi:hypothetical protein